MLHYTSTTRSTILFASLSLVLVAIKVLFDYYPGSFPERSQAAAFTWPIVAGIIALASAGLAAERAAGLPTPLEDTVRELRGFAWAAWAGALYGLVNIGMYVHDFMRDPHGPGAAWIHMALPWSLPFYLFGAILLEYMLRLGALCIAFWLIHVVLLRRRLRLTVYWILAAIVALYEIWPYYAADASSGHWQRLAGIALEPLYLSNVFEGWLLLRFGWLTPIIFRIALYLVWHIAFGGLAGSYFGH